jgi:diguanylate cyclase (GGDEF)-like protein
VLIKAVRSDDKACRDGGDEFLLLIDSAEIVAIERILSRVEDSLEKLNKKRAFPVQVALGFCLYDENQSFNERLEIADERMYTGKNEKSYIYRLAKKIESIKDPENLKELLTQIQKSIPENISTDTSRITK